MKSMLSTINKFIARRPSLAKQIRILNQGFCLCPSCSFRVDQYSVESLAEHQCEQCHESFFVPRKFDHWWAMEEITTGGVANLYRAVHHEETHIDATIKVMPSPLKVQTLKKNKALLSTFNNHPNLIKIFDAGYDENDAYIIVEKITGPSLAEIIEANKMGIPCELALYYSLDILTAIKSLYDNGFLYRDLKPQNITINQGSHAVLNDFGFCTPIQEAWQKVEKTFFGSPMYMAPERIHGDGEDFRADLYSLGMTLYHCIKGETYYTENELNNLFQRKKSPIRLRTADKIQTTNKLEKPPEELAYFIDKLNSVDRNDRYCSYDELFEDLHGLLHMMQEKETSDPIVLIRRKEYLKQY